MVFDLSERAEATLARVRERVERDIIPLEAAVAEARSGPGNRCPNGRH